MEAAAQSLKGLGRAPIGSSDRVTALERQVESLSNKLAAMPQPAEAGSSSILLVNGDLDKTLAALTMATGSAAAGGKTTLFFAFWGVTALRRGNCRSHGTWLERMFGWMLPKGTRQLKLSRMNMGGMGTRMMKVRMRQINMPTCEELLDMARELGVQFKVCEASMSLMGLSRDDLIDYPGLELCGVTTFMESAGKSEVSLLV